jgi:outer membrane murein-binding lipoprotein Lpp
MSPSLKTSRYANRVSFSFLVWMVVFAILVSAGGITYALFKNDQVAVRTEINNLNREIAVSNMNTNQHRAKTNALTNRWAMRDRLSQDRSTLRDIDRNQIELARRLQDSGLAVLRR